MRGSAIVGAAVAAVLLTGCAATTSPSAKAAPLRINENPYPSTYTRYPGAVTVIRGATVFDGEGGRIEDISLKYNQEERGTDGQTPVRVPVRTRRGTFTAR